VSLKWFSRWQRYSNLVVYDDDDDDSNTQTKTMWNSSLKNTTIPKHIHIHSKWKRQDDCKNFHTAAIQNNCSCFNSTAAAIKFTVKSYYLRPFFFFSGVSLPECCHVNTLPERMVAGQPPGWVDPNVGRLYISIDSRHPGRKHKWVPSRSSPMKQWLKHYTNDSVVLL